jgi:acetyltransferase-like isoleucine patch superfamily enzyme
MTQVRLQSIRATHLHCRVEFQGPVRLGPGFQLDIPDGGTFIVEPGVDFRRGFVCEIAGDGRVVVGAGTVFTSNALLQCSTSIEIGKRCAFGQSVLIVDGFHKYSELDRHWFDQGYEFSPIKIGDGVGVSDKCTIQASVGERSMIASHAAVTRPIPAFSVAAGAPARVVRYFGPDDQRPGKEPPASAGDQRPAPVNDGTTG